MVQNLCSRLIQPKAGSRGFGVGLSKLRLTLDVKVFVLMHSNFVRGLLKPWTSAAHALFSIISQTFTADRRAFHWRENEFCLHLQKADRDSCKKKKCEECPRRKTNPAHMQRAWDCGDISMKPLNGSLSNLSWGISHKFPNFLWPINYLGTQHQSWPKRQFKMKKAVKKTAFFTGQSHSFSFFACPSHSCELQTQLPQNEAPKQTTSSLDRSGHELSREPFIRAVRV